MQFRHVPGNLYKRSFGTDLDKATNELVIRVQPDEAIYLKINNKVPGLGMRLDRSNLNLHYAARYGPESLNLLNVFYDFHMHLKRRHFLLRLFLTIFLRAVVFLEIDTT